MGWIRRGFLFDRDVTVVAGSLTVGLLVGGWLAVRAWAPGSSATGRESLGLAQPTAAPAPPTPGEERLRPIEEAPLLGQSLPRLKIPQVGVNAPLEPVGLTAAGAMDIPRNGEVVAWYSLGPFPGGPGNAILAGHVDWQQQAAVFRGLKSLSPGSPLSLDFDRGAELQYTVTWIEQYPARAAPLHRVFDNALGSALTLITCGGPFNAQTRQYLDRIVVRAVRA